MGTYTTNYQLYMPTIGETGWGTLINGNYQTIDTTMKGLSNRIAAVENEVNGVLSCTSVTTSGKVMANGGITSTTGTFSGAVTGKTFNGVTLKSSGIITITPNNTDMGFIPKYADSVANPGIGSIMLLPVMGNITYSGSIVFHNTNVDSRTVYWQNGKDEDINSNYYIPANSVYTLTFTSIPYLAVSAHERYTIKYRGFTFS